ncbi:hypothetical protein HY572_02080 [Candidatus Micrarchaeota archaeon]|nr:hypothetical protein [Candidatus Micrarchaeota archaeon]
MKKDDASEVLVATLALSTVTAFTWLVVFEPLVENHNWTGVGAGVVVTLLVAGIVITIMRKEPGLPLVEKALEFKQKIS